MKFFSEIIFLLPSSEFLFQKYFHFIAGGPCWCSSGSHSCHFVKRAWVRFLLQRVNFLSACNTVQRVSTHGNDYKEKKQTKLRCTYISSLNRVLRITYRKNDKVILDFRKQYLCLCVFRLKRYQGCYQLPVCRTGCEPAARLIVKFLLTFSANLD